MAEVTNEADRAMPEPASRRPRRGTLTVPRDAGTSRPRSHAGAREPAGRDAGFLSRMRPATRPPRSDRPTHPNDKNAHPEPAPFRHLLTRSVQIEGRVALSGRSPGPHQADDARPSSGRQPPVGPSRPERQMPNHPPVTRISNPWSEAPIRESVIPVTAFDVDFL